MILLLANLQWLQAWLLWRHPATSQYVRQNDLGRLQFNQELPCFLLEYPSTNSNQDHPASWRSIINQFLLVLRTPVLFL